MYGPEENSLFILGAGASWHYGYPTGEQLVKKIVEKADHAALYFEQTANVVSPLPELPEFIKKEADAEKLSPRDLLMRTAEQCAALRDGLKQVNPLLIDYYLGWNAELQDVGRLFIAWVILECEKNYVEYRGNINRAEKAFGGHLPASRSSIQSAASNKKDDWCRFIIHQLAIDCKDTSDLLKNRVRFVTFNYDVSLERSLYEGLSHIKRFKSEDVRSFLSPDRVLHVYGMARKNIFEPLRADLPWVIFKKLADMGPSEQANHHSDWKLLLDYLYPASLGIQVIDPKDKGSDEDVIRSAREAIEEAKYVYILGYGFDENNSNRLRLPTAFDYQRPEAKRVHFTNFQNVNRVNKRAGKLMFNNEKTFPAFGGDVVNAGTRNYERSVRDVYEALELDFD